tara:strand:+ start:616 stop:1404 length:789 start_codon:yes stop_codon:yes gene_type:complete
MKKYLYSLRLFWSTALSAQLEYQFNFIIELIAMIGTLIGSIFILSLFFSDGKQLGEWTWESALVIQGIYTILDGITNTFLRPNLTEIVNYIREGTLDFVLLKPIDSQFWVSTRTISPSGLPEIFLGFILVIWSSNKAGAIYSISSIVCFFLALISAIVILYSLWFLIASTSIWFVKTWNATEVLRAILASGRYPISAYPVTIRFIFTLILPVAFLTTVPAEMLLNDINLLIVFKSFFFSSLFFYISRCFWIFALKYYTSASS